MKKAAFGVGFACLLSLLLLLSAGETARRSDGNRWAEQLLKIEENPFLRPWLEDAVQEIHASGMWSQYKSLLKRIPGARLEAAAAAKTFNLTFPHTVNGRGNGLAATTTVILVNNSETNAAGTIFVRLQSGAPMSIRTNQGTGSSFNFSLLPGEIYRLETDGSGPLLVGWVEVISDIQLSGSGTFVLSDSSGQFLSEVGIGDSPRARSLMIFVDTTEGKNAGYAVANPSASTVAKLRLQLKKLDGTLVASKENVPLAPLSQTAEFVTETFPTTDLRNFRGVLLVSTADTDIAEVTLRTRGVQFTSLPAAPLVSDTSKQKTVYLARVGDGAFGGLKFQTSAILMNNSDKKGTATLEFFKSDGNSMELATGTGRNSKFTLEVPAGGAVELLSDGSSNPGATGWARVGSDLPLSASGTFTIRNAASGAFVSEVGVPSSSDSTKLSAFAQVSADVDTGVGLTNIDSFAKTVTLRLIGESPSTVFAERPLQLGARGHEGRFVTELFSDVREVGERKFSGRLEAEGFGITALALRTRGAFLTSLPVAGFSRAAFAPKLTITTATSLEGSRPALCLQFSQSSGEAAPHKALFTFDKGRIDFSKITEDTQIIGNGFQNVLGLLFTGRCFSTETTSASSQFYCVPSLNGTHETVPFIGVMTNVPSGGFILGMEHNPGQYASLPTSSASLLCFNPDLIQLPSGSSTQIRVSEDYESFEQTPDAGDILKRNATSIVTTSALPAGNPRIDSVIPTRAPAGAELVVNGSNFAGTAAGNSVTVEGNPRLAATVTEAGSTRLKVKLPDDAVSGTLRVDAGGKTSNDYSIDVPFAPRTTLAFGSIVNNQETTLKLTMTQKSGQIAFLEVTLRPTQGSWKTGGFTAGALLGTMKLLTTTYDLKVKSSDSNKLAIDLIEQGKSSVSYTLEASNAGSVSLLLTPATFPDTAQLSGDLAFELNFTQPVFKMPSGTAVTFDVNLEIVSMPERNGVKATSFRVQRRQSFTTG